MALTLPVALLGIVLENTDFLTLAVLDDLGLHGRALHDGCAKGGVVAVDDGQNGQTSRCRRLPGPAFR